MSKFSHYSATAPQVGRLTPFPLTMLPARPGHGPPTLLIEYLGKGTNRTWTAHIIREANRAKRAAKEGGKADEVTEASIAEAMEADRAILREHAARGLRDVFYADGTEAGPEDVRDFVNALPYCDVEDALRFAFDHRNHRGAPASPPDAIAEKS